MFRLQQNKKNQGSQDKRSVLCRLYEEFGRKRKMHWGDVANMKCTYCKKGEMKPVKGMLIKSFMECNVCGYKDRDR